MDILFDANTLINGIFLSPSQSRKVLDKLWSKEITGFVCKDTLDEALKALDRACRNTGVDLSWAFKNTIDRSPLSILPHIAKEECSIFKRIRGIGDKRLVAAAKKSGFTICTNDINDFQHASEYGVVVITPDQLTDDGKISLERIVLGILALPEEGTIYIEAEPVWVGVNIDRTVKKRFYFFDSEGIGGLYFDNPLRALVYEGDFGQRVEFKTGVIGQESLPLRIAITYQYNQGISIYFGYQGRKAHQEIQWVPRPQQAGTRTFVGSDRSGNNQINGLIYHFTSLPSFLTERGINNVMRGNTTLYAWERLGVEEVIGLFYGGARINQGMKRITKLLKKGSATFWLRHRDRDWVVNEKEYQFGEMRKSGMSVEASKHTDRTINLLVAGPLGKDFKFHHPIPKCDSRGLFVAVTWKDVEVKLYFNGRLIEIVTVD